MSVKINSALNRRNDIVRTFEWQPLASGSLPFHVTLRYRALAEMNEEVEQQRVRTLQRQKHVVIDDVQAMNKQLEDFLTEILAGNIIKMTSGHPEVVDGKATGKVIAPTFRHLKSLLPLDPDSVAAAGGLDSPVPFDPTSEIADDRDAAKENIRALLNHCTEFRRWIETVGTDVGQFQDSDFEAQVKNSVARATK